MSQPLSHYTYQVGGSLPHNATTYVTRQADIDLFESLKIGKFCYVLNSRQMGKSSLRVKTMRRLQAEGYICIAIDLSGIGKEDVTPEKWYAGLVNGIVSGGGLNQRFQWRSWWREQRDLLSPVQRLHLFVEEILLKEIDQNIVIFIDEIDRVLAQSFSLDDFFSLVRFFYNQRVDSPLYRRLTFALLGVATPSELIQDKEQTPFNIGHSIDLRGFQLQEAYPLLQGLHGKVTGVWQKIAEIEKTTAP